MNPANLLGACVCHIHEHEIGGHGNRKCIPLRILGNREANGNAVVFLLSKDCLSVWNFETQSNCMIVSTESLPSVHRLGIDGNLLK